MSGELHHGLSFEAYRAMPGMNISALKTLRVSPLKFKHGLTAPHEETPSMALGTAAHIAILEPERHMQELVLWDGTRRGKDWEAFKAANQGKRIITASDDEAITGMRDAVRAYAPAMHYLDAGEAEVSMTWLDEETGYPCKGRLDWLTAIDGRDVIIDLKTTLNSGMFAFGAQAAKLGYHLQFAYYFDGFLAITGREPDFKVLAVESKPPHEPALYSAIEDVLSQGREEYRNLLRRAIECERENHWPPAIEEETPLSLPSWVYGSDDTDLSDLGLIA